VHLVDRTELPLLVGGDRRASADANHPHAKSGSPLGNRTADAAQADQEQGLTLQLPDRVLVPATRILVGEQSR